MKKIVCLTGGMGSGKSTVAQLLVKEGFSVYNSDARAKWLMIQPPLRPQIEELFGPSSYTNDGNLNRPFLSNQIFTQPEKKTALEDVVHPAVRSDFEDWLATAKGGVVFKESALTLELEDTYCHTVLVVECPENIRIERIRRRNPSWSLADIKARLANQFSDEQRRESGAVSVDNSGTLESLKTSLDQALTKCI